MTQNIYKYKSHFIFSNVIFVVNMKTWKRLAMKV